MDLDTSWSRVALTYAKECHNEAFRATSPMEQSILIAEAVRGVARKMPGIAGRSLDDLGGSKRQEASDSAGIGGGRYWGAQRARLAPIGAGLG